MNYDKLRGRIAEKRMKAEEVQKALNLSSAGLWRKMNGVTQFTRDEIDILRKILELNDVEVCAIFFTE